MVRLIPAPRGAGIVASIAAKKVLHLACINDCFTCSRGQTATMGNLVKATFNAMKNSYGFLTPDLWSKAKLTKSPYQEFTDELAKPVFGKPAPHHA